MDLKAFLSFTIETKTEFTSAAARTELGGGGGGVVLEDGVMKGLFNLVSR